MKLINSLKRGFLAVIGAAPRAATIAALTLYYVHKSALAVDVEVENIFDFTVPVSVISNGVWGAEANLWFGQVPDGWDGDDIVNYMYTNTDRMFEDLDTVITNNDFYDTLGDFRIGDSNYYLAAPPIITNILSLSAIEAATGESTVVLGSGPSSGRVSSFGFGTLNTIPSLVENEAAPSAFTGGIVQPISLAGPSSFFVQSLTVDALENIDGGRFSSLVSSISQDSILYWLHESYPSILSNIADFMNQSWISHAVRTVSKIGALACFFILAYKFCISKMWLIIDAVLHARRKGGVE